MNTTATLHSTELAMPALFVGHGSPMNAIENTVFSRVWSELGRALPRPKAILCISAHWETVGTQITAMEQPATIHDFYGFPTELFDVQYSAPGSSALAEQICRAIPAANIGLNFDWGLDHGCWSILCHLFPAADIPVLQLSLNRSLSPARHYALGKALGVLRNQGILIIGSGNIVHNLAKLEWRDTAHDWAASFDSLIKTLIISGDHQAIIDYEQLAGSRLAVPSAEHFLPLLYLLGMQSRNDSVSFFNETVTLGAISMTSFKIGKS